MDTPKSTPKDFFLWAGAMLSLYVGIVSFITLLFLYIEYVFADTELYQYVDPYQGGIAYTMASLIVVTPLFLVLMRVIRRAIAADPSRAQIWVRRWGLYLTVFIAGATVAIDLIVLLTSFLSGEELTAQFLLKVLVVLLVATAAFMHFLADIWGYWEQNPHSSRMVNIGVGVLVVLTIAAGFLIIGSPQTQRLYRIDQQRVYDLQSLQSEIITYYQQKEVLPSSLDTLQDSLSYYSLPVDPSTKQPYRYRVVSPLSFELCATFNKPSKDTGNSYASPALTGRDQNWTHGVGETCFTRTIDPDRYPPYPKPIVPMQ